MKFIQSLKRILRTTPAALLINLLWVYIAYFICRLAFLFENWSTFAEQLTFDSFMTMLAGGWRFDSSAIFYTNALFILLFLLPVHTKEDKPWYQAVTRWIYIVINSLCVIINLADSVFFAYRLQRSTMATLTEFQGEGNVWKIASVEFVSHWYFVLLAAAIIYCFVRLYRKPAPVGPSLKRYYITNSVTLAVMGLVAVCGMRGNVFFLSATRPISVGYAQRFVSEPVQTGIVLNTPFSLIRTIGQLAPETPQYFTEEELATIYSPLHQPADSTAAPGKNLVILMVESFAQEFIGSLNRDLDNGTYKGYTPFADSLISVSTHWEQSFANAAFSIDSPPALYASLPRMKRPFVVSPHSLNDINSLASELRDLGYHTAFFHGGDNESLGFNAFTRHAGFQEYFGMNEFYADPRFGGRSEFDGYWGIWDEPFLQFFAQKLTEMPQPFFASVFTLSSHHPFKVPEKYRDVFVDEGIFPLHKCIRYADYSLRRFFDTARRQPWYANTIFILSADHASSKRTHDVYKNELGGFRIPLVIFDPSGAIEPGLRPGIAQQIDIMPTMLNYLGVKKPYVAFGKDLFNTPAEDTWAFNWDHLPQYIKGDYLLQMTDSGDVSALFNYRKDPLLKNNLAGTGLPQEKEMLRSARAVIQTYMKLMNSNTATAERLLKK